MHALVTGGAGFIGSCLVDRLLAERWSVTALDNFDPYYDPAQKRRNVAAALRHPGYQLRDGDVRDAATVEAAFAASPPDVVIHLAARAGVRASVEDPLGYLSTNEIGALHVLEACRRRGGTPLVFASTSSIYGGGAVAPFREDDARASPRSPYAATKRASELMALTYHHLHALPVAILRFFTVYGPRGRPDMAFWLFTHALRHGQPIRLRGQETARDFTFVEDIVSGILGAIAWVQAGRGAEVFNLGRSEPHRVVDVIDQLARQLGVEPQIQLTSLDASECAVTAADIGRAQAAFRYRPETSLAAGVQAWLDWVDHSEEAPLELRGGAATGRSG